MYALKHKHAVSKCQRSDANDQNTKTLVRLQLVRCGKQGAANLFDGTNARPAFPGLAARRAFRSRDRAHSTALAQRGAGNIQPPLGFEGARRPAPKGWRRSVLVLSEFAQLGLLQNLAEQHSQPKQRSTTDIDDSWECPGAAAQTSGNVAYLRLGAEVGFPDASHASTQN